MPNLAVTAMVPAGKIAFWLVLFTLWPIICPAIGTIKIPFRYVQSFILLDVNIENKIRVKLIFDTGAEHTVLFEKHHTDIIKGIYVREIKILGADLKKEIPALVTRPVDFHFNYALVVKENLIVLKEKEIFLDQIIGERVDGILGPHIFKDYLIEINYKAKQISLHRRQNFKWPRSGYTAHPIFIHKNKPYVKASAVFNDTTVHNLHLLLDTGADVSVILYPNSNPNIQLPDTFIPGFLGSGIGGMIEGYLCKIPHFNFCNYHFSQVVCNLQVLDSDYSIQESLKKNGIIGNLLLDRFNLILDYHQSVLYLKPAKNFNRTFHYDKSGLFIVTGGNNFNKFYISQVAADSPAKKAGAMPGDEILSVNRVPTGLLNLLSIQKQLQSKANRKVRLKIRRNGQKRIIEFYLRELI